MDDIQPPLLLYVKNEADEDVPLEIKPEDDFQTFLDKAKSLLGYDVDINSLTRNQPVSLEDNVYEFLCNEQNSTDGLQPIMDPMLEPNEDTGLVYVLDDGTQINASQIHFDNDEPPIDLTLEKLPFVKHSDAIDEDSEPEFTDVRKINIVESPVSRWPNDGSSSKCDFGNTLPFKIVCNNTSGFESQFAKYLEEAKKPLAVQTVVTEDLTECVDENKERDFGAFTREEVINMFKDSPVNSLPYDKSNFNERKHIRKTDPLRTIPKSWTPKPITYLDVDGTLIGQNECQDCYICGKFIKNSLEKLYLFDNEDQRLHRSSSQKKLYTQLKILCQKCLDENFKPCFSKNPNQPLNSDEFLIIKNNQQYIYQVIGDIKGLGLAKNEPKVDDEMFKELDFSKLKIDSNCEIITGSLDNDDQNSGDIVIVKDEGSSDVEIIEEPEIDDIENLEEADEEVKEFLGKYECDDDRESKEMKCRFCQQSFVTLQEVIEHGNEHKHEADDGEVYPCPLCNYGYANLKWLSGHLRAAHDATKNIKQEDTKNDEEAKENPKDEETKSPVSKEDSPIAKRTRSANKNKNTVVQEGEEKTSPPEGETRQELDTKEAVATCVMKTEVKQEVLDSSDEESIWIVHTADEGGTAQLEKIFSKKEPRKTQNKGFKKMIRCPTCSEIYCETASPHTCSRRGRKRKVVNEGPEIFVPTEEDFIKRAQGRPRHVNECDSLLVPRVPKRKNRGPTSDPQVVTCHDCNVSFTSKVRLKFHIQFHDTTAMLTEDGTYACTECKDATFDKETELFDHIHFQHSKQRRWQCPVADCKKMFYLRATLTKHSRTHTDTRRYVCVTCGKRFLDKQTLDEHGVTHLQIKPFQCHICMKQLTRRSRLRMHLRAHEEELSPTLVLVCAVCSKAFRDHHEAQEHATKSNECIEVFANELKEEEESLTSVQLSPTSGLVTSNANVKEPSRFTNPIPRQVSDQIGEKLLSQLPDEAKNIIRLVEIEKAFRCEYCEDVFYSERGLNKHRIIHKGVKNPFVCHVCKVSFATYSRCTTHKTTHGFYKRSMADAKTKESNQSASSTGIVGYGGFPVVKHFLCEDCGRSYLHWTYLQVHRRMKHANENLLYKCNQCDITFPNSWSIAYHKKKVHCNATGVTTTKIQTVNFYRIQCRDCDEVLPNKVALYQHRKKEHSDLSLAFDSTQEDTWSDSAQHASITYSPSAKTCGKCGKNFDDVNALKIHYKEVHGNELQTCTICCKSFPNRVELQCHVRTHALRPYTCSQCGHSFRTASMRSEHLRTHTGERPFPCDVCGVAFRRSTAMRNHRLIHTGVRPWACARCPKRFRIRSDLRTHLRLKHPAYLAVIEMPTQNPCEEEIIQQLHLNNIALQKVIEISKISFPQGSDSIVPNSARALSLVGVSRTPIILTRPPLEKIDEFQTVRRGRGIAKNPRRPKIFQPSGSELQQDNVYPIDNVTEQENDTSLDMFLKWPNFNEKV